MTAQDAAFFLVALASGPGTREKVAADLTRKALAKISVTAQQRIEALWDAAHKESLTFLTSVLINNPTTPRAQVLARPDVQEAMTFPFQEAARQAETVISEAWEQAQEAAAKQVRGQLTVAGESFGGYAPNQELLTALVQDLKANAAGLRERYTAAMQADNPAEAMTKVWHDSTRRSGLSTSTAVWSAASEVSDSVIATVGMNKMWVATLDSKTCSHCAGLHGTVVGPNEEFPHDTGDRVLSVYRGVLLGPPRHPHCRCVLVAVGADT